jgi:hypothetical protein
MAPFVLYDLTSLKLCAIVAWDWFSLLSNHDRQSCNCIQQLAMLLTGLTNTTPVPAPPSPPHLPPLPPTPLLPPLPPKLAPPPTATPAVLVRVIDTPTPFVRVRFAEAPVDKATYAKTTLALQERHRQHALLLNLRPHLPRPITHLLEKRHSEQG